MFRSDRHAGVSDLRELVAHHLRSAKSSWSMGAFGAIAEFHRGPVEAADAREFTVVTAGGAIAVRLEERCRAFAYELLSARSDLWLKGTGSPRLLHPQAAHGMPHRAPAIAKARRGFAAARAMAARIRHRVGGGEGWRALAPPRSDATRSFLRGEMLRCRSRYRRIALIFSQSL